MNAPAAAGPPAVPGPADMAAQTPFGRLLCHDCHRPVGASPGFGFCRICGAPLCVCCASSNTVDADGDRAIPIPIYLIAASPSAAINPMVALCCDCWEYSNGRKTRFLLRFFFGAFLTALISLLILIAMAVPTSIDYKVCGTVFIVILAIVPIYWSCRYLDFRQYRPTCPVCGRSAVPFILRGLSRLRAGNGQFPDIIDCSCGYKGQRIPLDGLWLFVWKNGWKPLAGGPLENVGRASVFALKEWR